MKVLVTGGREFKDSALLYERLAELHGRRRITLVIQGGATGADALAKEWARVHDIACHQERAEWGRLGFSAGPIRNGKMLDMKPDIVVACPGNRGTADCIKQAEKRGIHVLRIGDHKTK